MITAAFLRTLGNDELHRRTKKQAEIVREESTILIRHLVEVERRHLFAKYKCKSLFQYCVDQLKMSDPQAGRYRNAARVMRDFPEVEEKLQTGTLSMTSVSQMQVFFNREASVNQPVAREEKQKILEQIENCSTRKTEKILLSHSSQPEAIVIEKVRAVTPTLNEIRLAADEEMMADIERLKEIWSHALNDFSLSTLMKKALRECVLTCDPMLKAERAQKRREKKKVRDQKKNSPLAPSKDHASVSNERTTVRPQFNKQAEEESKAQNSNSGLAVGHSLNPLNTKTDSNPSSEAASVVTSKGISTPAQEESLHLATSTPAAESSLKTNPDRTRYVHSTVRHAVYMRDQGSCDYIDPATGERCSSRHFLQLDHVVPYAMGGENTVENLRLRCHAHNTWHSIQSYGHDKAMKYSRCTTQRR